MNKNSCRTLNQNKLILLKEDYERVKQQRKILILILLFFLLSKLPLKNILKKKYRQEAKVFKARKAEFKKKQAEEKKKQDSQKISRRASQNSSQNTSQNILNTPVVMSPGTGRNAETFRPSTASNNIPKSSGSQFLAENIDVRIQNRSSSEQNSGTFSGPSTSESVTAGPSSNTNSDRSGAQGPSSTSTSSSRGRGRGRNSRFRNTPKNNVSEMAGPPTRGRGRNLRARPNSNNDLSQTQETSSEARMTYSQDESDQYRNGRSDLERSQSGNHENQSRSRSRNKKSVARAVINFVKKL